MVMAFLSDFAAGGVGAAAQYITSRSVTASLIGAALDEGISPTALLRGLRSAGLGIRTQNYYRLVGQVRTEGARLGNVASVLMGGAVAPGTITQLEGGQAGKYMVNVRSYYQYTDEAGDLIQEFRTTSVLQRTLDLTQALRDTTSLIAQNSGTGTSLIGQVIGLEVSGVYQWQGTA